jgi:hypothetical protein
MGTLRAMVGGESFTYSVERSQTDEKGGVATALYTLTLGVLGFIQAPKGTPIRKKGD